MRSFPVRSYIRVKFAARLYGNHPSPVLNAWGFAVCYLASGGLPVGRRCCDGDVEMELARCEYIQRRENVIAVGNSGTGKTHVALGLGLAACQRGCWWVSPPPPHWSTN